MSASYLDVRSSLGEMKEAMRAEYSAAKSSRFRRNRPGVSGVGRSSDYHLRNATDYYYMIEYVRDMHRNDGLIRQLTNRAVTLHIQTGFTIDFNCRRNPKLSRALYEDHYQWWMTPHLFDVGRTLNGPMAERLFFKQMLVDGDHVVFGLESGQIQSIEGHRIRTPYTNRDPELRLGVYKNGLGDMYRYVVSENEDDRYFAKVPKRDTRSVDTWLDGGAGIRQVFHMRSLERSSDTRGITAYCPVFDYAGMFEDTNFALLVKQQLAAFLALSKETQQGATPGRVDLGTKDDAEKDETERLIRGDTVRAGSVVNPGPGKTYKILQASIPSAETMAHIRFILQLLSLNLGMPLIAATLDASETNFSGWKGAMNIAEVGFLTNQDDFDGLFHTPLTRWRLWRTMNSDTALGRDCRAHADKYGVESLLGSFKWNKPRLKPIQPDVQAFANEKNLNNGTHSLRQIVGDDGRDLREVRRERLQDRYAEILAAHKRAERLMQQGVKDVTWRDLMSAGPPNKPDESIPKPQPAAKGPPSLEQK